MDPAPDHNSGIVGVLLSWTGSALAFFTAPESQLWIGIVAGTLSSIYTALKIYDWTMAWLARRSRSRDIGVGEREV